MQTDRQRGSEPVPPAQLRHAMAGFPTGISFVAAQVEQRRVGMLANSLVSVSLDPPLVSLSFDAGSTTWPILKRSPQWGISILGEHDADKVELLRRPAADRFRSIESAAAPGGALLLPGALATMTVAIEREVDAGDHTLVLLRVLEVHRDASQKPLVFFGSSVERLASR